MKWLLDTHTFLWFVNGSPLLSQTARGLIEMPGAKNLLSVASIWEMAIKYSLGKLSFSQPFEVFVPQQVARNGISVLPIEQAHLNEVSVLPFHHKDPFDRLIIAQGIVEKIEIISIDAAFDAYGVSRQW